MLALLAALPGVVATPRTAGAQYYDVYSNAPFDQLAGLQQAIQRLYQGENELNIYADVARFDSEANAAAGFETLNTYYLDAYATAGSPIAFEPADATTNLPGSLAYHALLDTDGNPYADMALVQAQDGVNVYSVFVSNYAYDSNPEEMALGLAVTVIDAMAVAPDGMSTPEAEVDGVMTGGSWTFFPLLGDVVLEFYGFTYSEDTEWFAVAESTPEPETSSDSSDLIYGDAEGLLAVIGRSYTPVGDGPEGVDDVYVEIAAFDDPDTAAAGFAIAETAMTEEIASMGADFEPVEADVESSDGTLAWAGPLEGTDSSLAVIVSRAESHVVAIVIIGDANADLLGFAEELSQVVIEADAGDSEETFDMSGGSTGGLWDKMPDPEDEVLQDLEPYFDDQLYP
jgi:hypothetical protein